MRSKSTRPLLIGLTGNIATGKSTVASMLAELGAETIDADRVVHELMRAGTTVHARIVDTFGTQVLGPDGEIDRSHLASIVFADLAALDKLEKIVHPATIRTISERIEGSCAEAVVQEAIKLIESGMACDCDSVWVTTCTPEQQLHRIMKGRGESRTAAEMRVRAQPPQSEKVARANVVIDTSGSLTGTKAQVDEAWKRFIRESRQAKP